MTDDSEGAVEAPSASGFSQQQESEFITEFDGVPNFWNFLSGLDQNDLIAELIQNDLDQRATRTVISFEQDRLVCEGNGSPVDDDGWKRLRLIQGAGDKVLPKQGKIGVKNHGLKTAFTIGDEIRVLSDSRTITQTLYVHGKDKSPYPGASKEPVSCLRAPAQGCRVEITYRSKTLELGEGEKISLRAVQIGDIDKLFTSACKYIPEQFAGIVSPEVTPRYEISMRHWRLGEARFAFSCTRPQKIQTGIQVFRRRCEITGSVQELPSGFREEAARRLLPLQGRIKERVPDFYRRDKRFFVEVSWRVDRRGKPQKGAGRFRYPIGYPKDSSEALTGHGVFFSAPIISDTERHAPERNEESNPELQQHCEALLVDVIARWVLPKWGPEAMKLLLPSDERGEAAVRPLLGKLIKEDAIPTVDWKTAVHLLMKRRHRKEAFKGFRRHDTRQPQPYRFVIPQQTWNTDSIEPSLAIICPPGERQLHPLVDPKIIEILCSKEMEGWCKTFITFDEDDAFKRLKGEDQYFSPSAVLDRELAVPMIASAYLDVIADTLDNGNLDADEKSAIQSALLLPDNNGTATRFDDLHVSVSLPTDVPGLRLPPILNLEIARHRLLQRRGWRRPPYTMGKFLQEGGLQDADELTRRRFWTWLRESQQHVKAKDRSKLANLPIWPDVKNDLYEILELCEPPRAVVKVLDWAIRRPHHQVRQSGLIKRGSKGRMQIRDAPTQEELEGWLRQRLLRFPIGDAADEDTKTKLGQFEVDLTVLLKDRKVGRLLRDISTPLPALAKDGSIQKRSELVMPNQDIARLALPGRFVLANNARGATLDKLSASLNEPTTEMLIAVFHEDPTNFGAVQARLRTFLALTKRGDDARQQVSRMPIIPVGGRGYAPDKLALKGSKGDYWGIWKVQLPARGLSQDSQKSYLDIGVTSATPTQGTSQAFFRWLGVQNPSVIKRHIACVLRHILEPTNGPPGWAKVFTDISWIPVRNADGIRLLPLQTALDKRKHIYLPDPLEKIVDEIIKVDQRVSFVIDSIQEITWPASKVYSDLGIQSLRNAIGTPVRVTGHGSIRDASNDERSRLEALRSSQFRKTFFRRLDKLGVDTALVRHNWFDRISQISRIKTADKVEVRYHFLGKDYPTDAEAGFDPGSKTFWIDEANQGQYSGFFETIAAQLIFEVNARPVDCMALERTLELEIHDRSFGQPMTPRGIEDEEMDHGGGEDGTDDEQNREPGEAIRGHAPFEPDPSRNIPKPSPLPTNVARTPRSNRPDDSSTRHNSRQHVEDQALELEEQHIKSLKQEQYASHCQMCLCERAPSELAPAKSYVEWEEVRRKVVEAHHVDPKSGGGARHAGNLILLCKLHHDNYGRRLTRESVLNALRAGALEKDISFDTVDHTGMIHGHVAKIVIPDTGKTISLFFTQEHADFWLNLG